MKRRGGEERERGEEEGRRREREEEKSGGEEREVTTSPSFSTTYHLCQHKPTQHKTNMSMFCIHAVQIRVT